jgi:phage major head subunit gpT-like protein
MKAYTYYIQQGLAGRICSVVPSDSDSEDYSWLGAVPGVREFVTERQLKDLSHFNQNIRNKTWENTLGVKRSDVEDMKLGMLKLRIEQLAEKAARYPGQLAVAYLLGALGSAAAPYLCYDGQGYFDTDHTAPNIVGGGGAVQVNKFTSALAIATLWAAIAAMRAFQDDRGEVMGLEPDLLLVEPSLEQIARELIPPKNASVGNAQSAVMQSMGIDVEVAPGLYSTATVANANWILMCTKGVIKPIILQQRKALEFGSLEDKSESGFMRDEWAYGTRARYNVGAGPWFLAIGNSGAA